ncbi:hypothetical protein BX616_003174 [Lobosporangium transversale]|uniref:Uncharacterized protein n=1 Tax=Lobosporangium transversale TaxID=64571 RepID=A0A1Y2GMH8_9FUNG|nr:hypothetical protein BCR41DRAFT_396400 [Lobosporangium transversale]KAF9899203.1 hypothetical protein BX616_003174 [Lobosporangium transversale]ORZ15455.1 hypothetical protein BCR41DRAFT_396400 [Lobosporangium transversale]|eukprot:XP_021881203.1 hypothetical protein BCR41DRAFT_396400 [Lobosporangium transversale]
MPPILSSAQPCGSYNECNPDFSSFLVQQEQKNIVSSGILQYSDIQQPDKHPFESDLVDLKAGLTAQNCSTLMAKIYSKLDQLSEVDRSRRHLVILYSDLFCPILKYHAELLSEIVRVLPEIVDSGNANDVPGSPRDTSEHTDMSNTHKINPLQSNVLAVVMSLKSDLHVRAMLAAPFHMDLYDRKHLADIQVQNASTKLQSLYIVDDSWALLQARFPPASYHSSEELKEQCVQLFAEEFRRLDSILASISTAYPSHIGLLEPICVLDQSESEIYGVPTDIAGKVIFIVTKDREERPKAVALKTRMHWIDRIFERSGYSLEWVHENVIPLYVELPDSPPMNPCQRPEMKYTGCRIRLSCRRPVEAYTRVKVRQGQGTDVLEPSVLAEVERTQIFKIQTIRRPLFEDLMGNMTLDNKTFALSGSESCQDNANPFL